MADVIQFPGDPKPPTASEDPYLESIAMQADAMNRCKEALFGIPGDDRRVILAALMGAALCESGRHPSRSLAIALIGPVNEMLFDYIDKHYGPRETWAP